MLNLRTIPGELAKLVRRPSPLFLRSAFVFVLVFVGTLVLHSSAQAAVCWDDPGACLASGTGKVIASILLFCLSILAWLLGIVGQLFNWAMLVTVFQFAYYFGNSSGLLLAWGILRDFANIALLFGFIFMGIAVILDLHSYPWKKTLPTLIIYAVLLNFSLFAAEAIIDTSNAVSSVFYQQATGENCRSIEDPDACASVGLAGKGMEITGVASILSGDITQEALWDNPDGVKAATVMVGLFFFVLITLFVFLVGSIMLISRAVTLMLLMVTSPIGFAGLAIPPLQKFANDWWDKLIQNVLFAPVFVLLMLIGFKILEGLRGSFVAEGTGLVEVLLESDLNTGGVFVLFALAIGFMYAALTAAKNFSIAGANTIVGSAEKAINGTVGFMGGMAGGATFGVAAGLGRFAIGRPAHALSQTVRRNLPGPIGNIIAMPLDKAASSSWDGRGTGFTGKALGEPTKAQRGGARGVVKEREKRKKEFDHSIEEREPTAAQNKQIDEIYERITNAKERLVAAEKAGDHAGADAARKELDATKKEDGASGLLEELKEVKDAIHEQTELDRYRNARNLMKTAEIPIFSLFIDKTAFRNAARSIRKDIVKSPRQKFMEHMEKIANKDDDDDHGHKPAAAPHAPPPPPPSGSGAGSPPPPPAGTH